MSSSSFFLKAKPKSAKKRKVSSCTAVRFHLECVVIVSICWYVQFIKVPLGSRFAKKNDLPQPIKSADDNEEIPSSDEDEEQANVHLTDDEDNAEDIETPQDKRLKLAKIYLQEIEKEEQARADDKELLENNVSQRLANDYLDSVGKLRRHVADDYTGHDAANVSRIKHKLHELPMTCVCLTSDDKYLFTGNKSAIVIKWDVETMKMVGHFDCNNGQSEEEARYSKKKRRPQTYALAVTTDSKYLVRFIHLSANQRCFNVVHFSVSP